MRGIKMRLLLRTSPNIEHYTKCAINQETFDYDFAQFIEKYPNYCRICEGIRWDFWGGTYWEPPETHPCPGCTEQDICGLCGVELTEESDWETCVNNYPEEKSAPFFECYCDMQRDYNDYKTFY